MSYSNQNRINIRSIHIFLTDVLNKIHISSNFGESATGFNQRIPKRRTYACDTYSNSSRGKHIARNCSTGWAWQTVEAERNAPAADRAEIAKWTIRLMEWRGQVLSIG